MARPKTWQRKEKWRQIDGFDGRYSVSNMGRVKRNKIEFSDAISFKKTFIIKPKLTRGSAEVGLYTKDKKRKWHRVKNLVGKHWLGIENPFKVRIRDKTKPFDCSIYNIKNDLTKNRITNAIINKKQAQEIKQIIIATEGSNLNKSKIARIYNISEASITLISQGKRWGNIEPILPLELE
jgi:hypothetical protein